MGQEADGTVYQPLLQNRLLGLLGAAIAYVGATQATESLAWLFLVPAGAVLLGNLWRRAVLSDTELRVQGRWTRRTVRLADIVQVGTSPFGVVWVQPGDATAFEVRMVSESFPADQGAVVFVADVRARAEAAGAILGPPLSEPTNPEGASSRVFSW